jgi:hypothetical protein
MNPQRGIPQVGAAQAANSPTQRRKESAVIRRATLRKQRGAVERASAWFVLLLSVIGSVAALAGGFVPLIAGIIGRTPQWSAIIGGLGLQAILTFLEWYYFDSPLVSWPARLVDTVTTAIGYGPLFLAALVAFLVEQDVAQAGYVAWGIIGGISFLVAYFPESRLVD